MAFVNPFNRVKNFDNNGYLRVNVKNFLELENRPQQFYDAIRELQTMREGLIVAQQGGLINQIESGFNFYKLALDWLRLNTAINQGVAVSAITTYDDINESVAVSFYQYVEWLRNNYLAGQALYQNIQIRLGEAKLDKLRTLDLRAEEVTEEFRESLHESQTKLAESTDSRNRELSEQLDTRFNTQKEAINQARVDAVNEIKQAQSLTIWHEAYEENIRIYTKKLEGINWKSLDWRGRVANLRARKDKIIAYKKTYKVDIKNLLKFNFEESKTELKLIGYVISRALKFFVIAIFRSSEYLFSKLFLSVRGQRLSWFVLLGVILVGQSLVFLSLLLKGTVVDITLSGIVDGSVLKTLASSEFIFAKISIYIGLILVPSIGYAFANRNYRIYSNLLEQYRHRATVAQTLQGILRYVDESENNKDIRMSLTTVAAVAMFEMKNVGHLTKRDGDTLPVGEIIQGVLKR